MLERKFLMEWRRRDGDKWYLGAIYDTAAEAICSAWVHIETVHQWRIKEVDLTVVAEFGEEALVRAVAKHPAIVTDREDAVAFRQIEEERKNAPPSKAVDEGPPASVPETGFRARRGVTPINADKGIEPPDMNADDVPQL